MYGVSRLDMCEEIALIHFTKIPTDLELLSNIFDEFSKEGVVLDMISQTSPVGGNVSLSFTCSEKDLLKVLGISKRLGEKSSKLKPLVGSGNCKIVLYGEEMVATPGVYARALQALAQTDIGVEQVTTSDYDISLLVPSSHVDEAREVLKKAFAL